MAITFRYVHVPRKDGTLRKAPFIPIYANTLDGKTIRIIALLDSGADTTVVPKEIAELLGLKELQKEMDTGGIGGKVKVKESRMQFWLDGQHEKHQMNIPVLIMQDINEDMPVILGRQGFFENFDIIFRQNEEKITLKKVQSKRMF